MMAKQIYLIILLFLFPFFLSSQESEIPICCDPTYFWGFDELVGNCTPNIPECGEQEITLAMCHGCISGNAASCCNYISTHGTPSMREIHNTQWGKIWSDSRGSEGLAFCIDDIEPTCFNLTFDFIKDFGLDIYDNNLIVAIVNPDYLPEYMKVPQFNLDCYDPPPSVPAQFITQIISIPMNIFPVNNTLIHSVSVNFSTNVNLIASSTSAKGSKLWFYPSTSTTSDKGIALDNIALTVLHRDICEDVIFLDNDDVPIEDTYEANYRIQIRGNPLVQVNNALFRAGERVLALNSVNFQPKSNSDNILMKIESICQDCPAEAMIDGVAFNIDQPFWNPDERGQILDKHNITESTTNITYASSESGESTFYISDIIEGVLLSFKADDGLIDQFIEKEMEDLVKGKIYYISRERNSVITHYKTVYNH